MYIFVEYFSGGHMIVDDTSSSALRPILCRYEVHLLIKPRIDIAWIFLIYPTSLDPTEENNREG